MGGSSEERACPRAEESRPESRVVYSTGLFGHSYEYVTIPPMDTFASFDAGTPLIKALGEAAAARLGEKLRKCTASANSFQATPIADLSNTDPANPWPAMILTTRLRVAPGKMADFQALIKTDVLP